MRINLITKVLVLSLFVVCITAFNYGGCGGGGNGGNNGSSWLAQAGSPNPADNSINVPITSTLSWSSVLGATSYDV